MLNLFKRKPVEKIVTVYGKEYYVREVKGNTCKGCIFHSMGECSSPRVNYIRVCIRHLLDTRESIVIMGENK